MRMLSHLYALLALLILLGASHERDLVLMVVRMSDYYLIKPHDEDERDHGDDHGEGKLAPMQTRAFVLQRLRGEKLVEVFDRFGDDVNECD